METLNLRITDEDIRREIKRREDSEARLRARTDLFYLMTEILGRKDMDKPWLKDRCDEVNKDRDGYLDLWFREAYKSTIITYGLTIQDILRSHGDDPMEEEECTFGIFSHTRPAAKGFLRQIKLEFENNQRLKDLFPDIFYQEPKKQAVKWSEDDGIIVKRKGNPKEATVEAWGVVDGQPTGKHFTHLVYDDIVTKESVTTPDQIKNTTDSLVLSYNLGARGGKRRFIGTRYHMNDTYREVIARGTAKPRIYTVTEDGTATGQPVLLTREQVAEKRRDMGAYIFSAQMLQNPVGDASQSFKQEHLKFYKNLNLSGLNVYIIFDPAHGKKKENDYTAGMAIGLGSDMNIYVIDMLRDRLNLTERTAKVMSWHRTYKPMRDGGVRYERYGLQADIEHIRTQQESLNYRFDIVEVGGNTPKNDRIKRLLPYFEQGRIWFPERMNRTDYQGITIDLVQSFINDEYLAFPVPVHDDMLDCLARLADPDFTLEWPSDNIPKADYSMVGQSWNA